MRRISDTEEEPNSVVDAVVGVVSVSTTCGSHCRASYLCGL